MSRIGKKAVSVPTGVTANVEGQTVKVKGPKGALQVVVHDDVSVIMDKGSIKLEPRHFADSGRECNVGRD
jgi:large subunit ribosomal protein L6